MDKRWFQPLHRTCQATPWLMIMVEINASEIFVSASSIENQDRMRVWTFLSRTHWSKVHIVLNTKGSIELRYRNILKERNTDAVECVVAQVRRRPDDSTPLGVNDSVDREGLKAESTILPFFGLCYGFTYIVKSGYIPNLKCFSSKWHQTNNLTVCYISQSKSHRLLISFLEEHSEWRPGTVASRRRFRCWMSPWQCIGTM